MRKNTEKQPILDKKTIVLILTIFLVEMLFPQTSLAQVKAFNGEDGKVLAVRDYISTTEQITAKRHFIGQENSKADKPEVSTIQPRVKKAVHITVTAYSSTIDQTDNSPYRTASMTYVRDGVLAANFLPIGTRVRLPDYSGDKIYIVEDRMNPRYNLRADIWMPDRAEAKQFGVKYLKMEIL